MVLAAENQNPYILLFHFPGHGRDIFFSLLVAASFDFWSVLPSLNPRQKARWMKAMENHFPVYDSLSHVGILHRFLGFWAVAMLLVRNLPYRFFFLLTRRHIRFLHASYAFPGNAVSLVLSSSTLNIDWYGVYVFFLPFLVDDLWFSIVVCCFFDGSLVSCIRWMHGRGNGAGCFSDEIFETLFCCLF